MITSKNPGPQSPGFFHLISDDREVKTRFNRVSTLMLHQPLRQHRIRYFYETSNVGTFHIINVTS